MRRETSRVIVGIDNSLAGLRALRFAVTHARRTGAALHAVRAWDSNRTATPECWFRELEQEAADAIVQAFDQAMGGMPTDIAVTVRPMLGSPARLLVRCAHRDNDTLVVGSSRRGWLRQLWHRSVARYCATHATCPVLVVPPDTFAREVDRDRRARAVPNDLSVLSG